MATYRTLPSGKTQAQIRLSGHKPVSASFNTKEEAKAWVATQTTLLEAEQQVKAAPVHTGSQQEECFYSFKELGTLYVDVGLKGKKTQEEMRRVMNWIDACFKELHLPSQLSKITPQHINKFRLHRLKSVSGSTCRRDLWFISKVYKFGKREYLLELNNPVDAVAIPSANKPRTRVIERGELDAILVKLPPVMAAISELGYETAMRLSELVYLTRGNLHLEDRYLEVVDGKTGDRLVPLTKRAVEILLKASEGLSYSRDRLFDVEPKSVSRAFTRARMGIGLSDDVCFHQLRHTRITEVARKGFNIAQIMMVSGHRDVHSVQRYTHLNVKDVVDLMD